MLDRARLALATTPAGEVSLLRFCSSLPEHWCTTSSPTTSMLVILSGTQSSRAMAWALAVAVPRSDDAGVVLEMSRERAAEAAGPGRTRPDRARTGTHSVCTHSDGDEQEGGRCAPAHDCSPRRRGAGVYRDRRPRGRWKNMVRFLHLHPTRVPLHKSLGPRGHRRPAQLGLVRWAWRSSSSAAKAGTYCSVSILVTADGVVQEGLDERGEDTPGSSQRRGAGLEERGPTREVEDERPRSSTTCRSRPSARRAASGPLRERLGGLRRHLDCFTRGDDGWSLAATTSFLHADGDGTDGLWSCYE